METIAAIAVRKFTRNGNSFVKDDPITLSPEEFAELEPVGLVVRAPAPAPAPARGSKTKAAPDDSTGTAALTE